MAGWSWASELATINSRALKDSAYVGVAVLDTLQLSVVSSMLEAVGPALKGHLDALEKLCLKLLLGGKSSVGAILEASRVLSLIPQATGKPQKQNCLSVYHWSILEEAHLSGSIMLQCKTALP